MSLFTQFFSARSASNQESSATGADARRLAELESRLAALDRSQAVIEFTPDGTILAANDNFCRAMGYAREEIVGRHHRMFMPPQEADKEEYHQFWARLAEGRFDAGRFLRVAKGGREIWIQASYNPVFGPDGRTVRIVKYATDVTAEVTREADLAGQVTAINRSQAVIEFALDGTILTANENFCTTVGYTLDEIRGQHHRMFVPADVRDSAEYRAFWQKLGRGEFEAGQYLRIAKGGRPIWIQASYNPVLDPRGKPIKVVKFATDITAEKQQEADFTGQLAAIGKAQAVIEFELDGTIRTANENFCAALGYTLEEIRGRHHRIFVDETTRASAEYRQFWDKLARGEYDSAQYPRIRKDGTTIWIQASYNPIFDAQGRPFKIVKYATDITAQKRAALELERVMVETSRVMGGLAQGDLTLMMEGTYEGQFAQLQEAVNASVANLRNMVNRITEAAQSISTSSSEIATGNQDLSQRTEEQATNLQQTASSMEELSGTVEQNADNAHRASELAAGARAQAETGGEVAKRAISAMEEINQSSKRISEIISVIDEIAFQTNLLALNAAVEAARAGEQGRGFAVVASEVRNLAQRSAGAAKEIKTLIKDSGAKVEEGSRLVNESGSALEGIVASTRKVSDIIAEIAAASQQQSAGIAEVNKAVAQMEQVVQQNAALVEEAAAASESMSEQSRGLADMMQFFRLDGATTLAAAAPRVERRGVNRPWSKPPQAAARAPAAPPVPQRAAAGGGGGDWDEF